jgi:F-type H+-transporting ATPase subunit b
MRRGLLCFTTLVAIFLAALVSPSFGQAAAAQTDGDNTKASDHAGGAGAASEPHAREPLSITDLALDLTVWTIVVFIGLLLVLGRYAWKPMLEGLQKREQAIESAIEQAKKDQEEAAALRAQHQQELTRVKEQERAIMEQAHRDGQAVKDRMVAEARKEIEEERERARRDNQSEREQAMRELLEQTAQLATLVATKAIRRTVTLDDQRRLVDEAVAELNFTADGGSKA